MERSIQRAIEIRQKKMANDVDARGNGNNIQDIVLLGKTDDYTETEKLVAYIYAGVLDIKEIDIYDNYNSLGGNSMTSTEILKMLNQYFDGMLEVSDVFSYPTVVEMAEYIDNKRNEQKQAKEKREDVNTLIGQLESGEIEVDKMLEMFDDD
jgi:polyketide synthase PksN